MTESLQPGDPIDVRFPDGWQSGWEFIRTVGATDRPYRVVARKGFYVVDGAAPECIRPTEKGSK